MKSYVKLVNFEVNRFFKLYMILMAFVIVVQVGGVILEGVNYMNSAQEAMVNEGLSVDEFINNYLTYSFEQYIYSLPFTVPVLFSIAFLVMYVFFIWYRDWFGKSKFMYRLLMLPTARRNIYFAKLTTILLCTLGMIALQILLVAVEHQISNWIVDEALRKDIDFFDIFIIDILYWLYPATLLDFFVLYGLGVICVAIVFLAILLERSYHLKGIFMAIGFSILAFALFIGPLFLNEFLNSFFYPVEMLSLMVLITLLITGCTIWASNYILTNKIKV